MALAMAMRLAVAAAAVGAAAGSGAWELAAAGGGPSAPMARREAVLAYDAARERLLLYGGRAQEGGAALGDTWSFDVRARSWKKLATTGDPEARFSLTGGVEPKGGRLVVFGGELQDKTILNDVWALDLETQEWAQLSELDAPGAPERRYGHAGGVVAGQDGESAFLLASHGFDLRNRWSNSFAFDLSDNTWRDITPADGVVPTGRCLVGGAAMSKWGGGARVGMFGGCGSGGYGPCPSSEMWVLNVDAIDNQKPVTKWSKAPRCAGGRNYAAMAADPTRGPSGTFLFYGGAGGPLVPADAPGQLNTVDAGTLAVGLHQFPGEQPGQPSGNQQSAMAVGPGQTAWLQLGGSGDLYMLNYTSVAAFGELEQEPCRADPVPAARTVHGVLMGLSWGFLLPVGVFIARFGRVRNPLWFKLHRGLQTTGLVLAVAGFVMAILMVSTGKFLAVPHAPIGLVVTFLGVQQPLNAVVRPHKVAGQPVELRRKIWEYWHKYSGRVALLLGMINPFLGISFLSGPGSPGMIVYGVWVAIYWSAWLYLSARGLPYTANGPSVIAQWLNSTLCCCLAPWNDSFRPRSASAPSAPSAGANAPDADADADAADEPAQVDGQEKVDSVDTI